MGCGVGVGRIGIDDIRKFWISSTVYTAEKLVSFIVIEEEQA